jgi:hypothetical protein
MELTNHTSLPALICRGCLDEERMCAAVVVRRTYDLAGGELRPAAEQVWRVSPGPWDGPAGPMAGDELFYRGGVDLLVLGSARAPGGRPVRQLDVTVAVGDDFRYRLAVFGDRVWRRQHGRLVPSEPEPFTSIPLTLARAFGGKYEWDELIVPFADNPDGKGYYVQEESADGQPLPNLEDPQALIRRWQDQPEPVGVGLTPGMFGPRLRRGVEVDERAGRIAKLHPTLFNTAFPALVLPKGSVTAGTRVRIDGVSADGPLAFTVPPSDLRVRLRFGKQVTDVEPAIDQLGVEPDARRVFVSYRYPFHYRLIPLQERACELLALAAEEVAP